MCNMSRRPITIFGRESPRTDKDKNRGNRRSFSFRGDDPEAECTPSRHQLLEIMDDQWDDERVYDVRFKLEEMQHLTEEEIPGDSPVILPPPLAFGTKHSASSLLHAAFHPHPAGPLLRVSTPVTSPFHSEASGSEDNFDLTREEHDHEVMDFEKNAYNEFGSYTEKEGHGGHGHSVTAVTTPPGHVTVTGGQIKAPPPSDLIHARLEHLRNGTNNDNL